MSSFNNVGLEAHFELFHRLVLENGPLQAPIPKLYSPENTQINKAITT